MKSKLKLFFIATSLFAFDAISAMEKDPNDLLMCAIEKEDFNGVVQAVKAGADINYHHPKYSFQLPLHEAVGKGNIIITKWLVCQPDIDIDKPDVSYNGRALHIAARHQNPVLIRLLIKYGALLGVQNNKLEIPLHLAVERESLATVHAMITRLPFMDRLPKPPCLVTLLCCFKRFKTMEYKIKIPKDIQLLLCRYCLQLHEQIVDKQLTKIQTCLKIKNHNQQTPFEMARETFNYWITFKDQEDIRTGCANDNIKSFAKIALLLDPHDDQHRRKAIEEVVYQGHKVKIPGVNQMPKY